MHAPRHFVPLPGPGLPRTGPAGAIGVADSPLLAASRAAAVIDVTALDGAAALGTRPAIALATRRGMAWLAAPERCGPAAHRLG
jgi:hypothetical protein